jgi:hypothetical protein
MANEHHTQDPSTVDALLSFLRSAPGGPEPYVFVEDAPEKLSGLLDAAFGERREPVHEIDQWIRLGMTLDDQKSPGAAGVIRRTLAQDMRVGLALARAEEDQRKRLLACAQHWTGGKSEPTQAPRFGAPAPEGTLKATVFIPPVRSAR